MEKQYIVSYSTLDKVVREILWEPSSLESLNGCIFFLENGEWPEYAKVKEQSAANRNVSWGLIGPNIFESLSGTLSLPNAIKYDYYRHVLTEITGNLGMECTTNSDLATAILKKALEEAKARDEKRLAEIWKKNPQYTANHPAKDNLARAKKRLSYYKKRSAIKGKEYYEYELAQIYTAIIQEFDLYIVLEIQPYVHVEGFVDPLDT